MADYDHKHGSKTVAVITPAVVTGDNTPTAIDTIGFKAVNVGTHVGIGGITFDATNKIEFKLTHSEDNVTYAAVDADDVLMPYGETLGAGGIIRSLTAAKAAADTEVHVVGYRGKQRYLKLLADFSGTHGSGTPMSAYIELAKPLSSPVGQQSFVPSLNKTAQ